MPASPTVQGISKFRVNRNKEEKKVVFQADVEIFNPNRFKIKIIQCDLTLFLNGARVGEAHSQEKTVLAKRTKSLMPIAVETDLKHILGGVLGLLTDLIGGDISVRAKVVGTLKARARGISKYIPVDFEKSLSIQG
jgi:LEA14-like dessication related protein